MSSSSSVGTDASINDQTTDQLHEENAQALQYGSSVQYQAPTSTINPDIAKDFDTAGIEGLKDMQAAYGVKFSAADLKQLAGNKFIVKHITETTLTPPSGMDNEREFSQLYSNVAGPRDPHKRGPQNAEFYSSDVFFNAYNNLYTELLKEMENKTFYPNLKNLSKAFYDASSAKLAAAQTDADKSTWMKVRNYFAVPYAIFSTAAQPLSNDDYYKNGEMLDPEKVQADFTLRDAKVDTYDNVSAFVKNLKLDAESQVAVLADLKQIYTPTMPTPPEVFKKEYADYAAQTTIGFKVDFTQFTPRGSYTSSSLRRQYFRGVKWFIMLPFFVKSADLTRYAFAITQLMSENPQQLADYSNMESAIGFMVGSSDDLMPTDYLQALVSTKNAANQEQAISEFLLKAHPPQIKDLSAAYPCVGCVTSDEALLASKGMRFFSGKFIIDSYWTGQLTQGDEPPRPGYTQKLPPMASSLEVMSILGSDYAKSQIPKLDFYTPKYSQAVDKAVADLTAEQQKLTDVDWTKNLYTSWFWTIKSLFTTLQAQHDNLPRFMQSTPWAAKTLQTATAFWTELRHATILYAKQSFAEMGAGPGECDPSQIPSPPKAYVEPQAEAYAKLVYLAKRTDQGLKDQGFGELNNLRPLENYIGLMQTVQAYVSKELGNTTLTEHISKNTMPDPYDETKQCTYYEVDQGSDWETLRLGMLDGLESALPLPVEGPILTAKDRRAALVADVHTGGDSDNPTKILYEGEGAPYVIFTAVKDANGARLTVGFISSQFEFTKELGGPRMTDEDWQKNFYTGTDTFNAFQYTPAASWPKLNPWYAPIFGN